MHIEYNGVYLSCTKLIEYDRLNVYDQSGLDWLYERHIISVVAVVSAGETSYEMQPDVGRLKARFTPGYLPGHTDELIRKRLLTPRQKLVLTLNPVRQVVVDTTRDVNNGPIPREFTVIKMLGDNTWLVRYVIEFHLRECVAEELPTDSGDQIVEQVLLSNRYSATTDVDEQHCTVMTYSGISIFRTDLLNLANVPADHYRAACIPPVTNGGINFRRIKINVTAVPSRNAIVWTVVDKQVKVPLGNPMNMVDFQAIFTCATTPSGGEFPVATGNANLTLQCRAVGTPASHRWNLAVFCLSLATEKCLLGFTKIVNGKRRSVAMTRNLQLSYHLHDNIVELQCTTTCPLSKTELDAGVAWPGIVTGLMLENNIKFLSNAAGESFQPPKDSNTRGDYGLEIVLQTFTEACKPVIAQRDPAGIGLLNYRPTPSEEGEPIETETIIYDPPPISEESEGLSDNAIRDRLWGYTHYAAHVKYETNQGTVIMPLCTAWPVPLNADRLALLQAHAPFQIKKISFEGTRNGRWPEIPNPYTLASMGTNPDEVLVGTPEVYYSGPITAEDGTSMLYTVKGLYTYAYRATLRTEGVDSFQSALVPWVNGSLNDAIATPDSVVRYISEFGNQQPAPEDADLMKLPFYNPGDEPPEEPPP